MLKFVQGYYKVVFEPLPSDSPFFAPGVTLGHVQRYAEATNPPVYISDVTFERLLLLTVTSRAQHSDIKAAIAAHVQKSVDVRVTVDGHYQRIINESPIQLLERGSTRRVSIKLLTPEGRRTLSERLLEYLRAGSDFSLSNLEAPIAFSAHYLGTRQLASAALVTDFTEAVSLWAPEVNGAIEIWDGPGGGPKDTGYPVAPGDRVVVTASGENGLASGGQGPMGLRAGSGGAALLNRDSRCPRTRRSA
jgi:hypothetical protein